MNVIMKELKLYEVLNGEKVITEEELAECIEEELADDIDTMAVVKFIKDNYYHVIGGDINKVAELILSSEYKNEDGEVTMKEVMYDFNDRYYGYYHDDESFASNYFYSTTDYEVIKTLEDSGIDSSIDWEKYWNRKLKYEFSSIDGYYFKGV